jgi:hypothetical protein
LVKDVPSDALPFASVDMIGGMTRKCKNLVPSQEYGVKFPLRLRPGVYTVSVLNPASETMSLLVYREDGTRISERPTATAENIKLGRRFGSFTLTEDCYYAMWAWGTGQELKVIDGQLEVGSTPTEYEPYFDGLGSALVTEVESVGVNLIPYPYYDKTKTVSGIEFIDNGNGTITINGTATNVAEFLFTKNNLFEEGKTYTIGGTNGDVVVDVLFAGVAWGGRGTFTVTKAMLENSTSIETKIRIAQGVTVSNLTIYPMLSKGSAALPYAPYVRNAFEIPEAVLALDGYGIGLNESVYNYVDFEKRQFVKKVGELTLDGNGTIWKVSNTHLYNASLMNDAKPVGRNRVYALCNAIPNTENTLQLDVAYITRVNIDKGLQFNNVVKNFGISECTQSAFNAYLAENPMTFYYELAEPIVTDISDILPDGFYIEVEGGGTVTMVNEHQLAVPSEITYQVKRVMA